MKDNLPAVQDLSDEMIKALVMDIAKNVVSHLKFTYRDIITNAPSTFSLSIRNGIYNQIMATIKRNPNDHLKQMLFNQQHRRKMSNFNKTRSQSHE